MTIGTWRSHFHPRWVVVTLIGILGVLTLTHIPQDAIPPGLQRHALDKVEHVVAYGLVAALCMLSLRRPVPPALALAVPALLAGIAALDEVTQPWVNRQAGLDDYVADLIGITVACGVVFLIRRVRLRAP